MGLVKGIPSEGLNEVKHLRRYFLGEPLLLGATDKALTLLFHQLGYLLAHGLPHHIGLSQAVAGEGL